MPAVGTKAAAAETAAAAATTSHLPTVDALHIRDWFSSRTGGSSLTANWISMNIASADDRKLFTYAAFQT